MRDTVRVKERDVDEDRIISRDEREWTTRIRLTRTVNEKETSERERRRRHGRREVRRMKREKEGEKERENERK